MMLRFCPNCGGQHHNYSLLGHPRCYQAKQWCNLCGGHWHLTEFHDHYVLYRHPLGLERSNAYNDRGGFGKKRLQGYKRVNCCDTDFEEGYGGFQQGYIDGPQDPAPARGYERVGGYGGNFEQGHDGFQQGYVDGQAVQAQGYERVGGYCGDFEQGHVGFLQGHVDGPQVQAAEAQVQVAQAQAHAQAQAQAQVLTAKGQVAQGQEDQGQVPAELHHQQPEQLPSPTISTNFLTNHAEDQEMTDAPEYHHQLVGFEVESYQKDIAANNLPYRIYTASSKYRKIRHVDLGDCEPLNKGDASPTGVVVGFDSQSYQKHVDADHLPYRIHTASGKYRKIRHADLGDCEPLN